MASTAKTTKGEKGKKTVDETITSYISAQSEVSEAVSVVEKKAEKDKERLKSPGFKTEKESNDFKMKPKEHLAALGKVLEEHKLNIYRLLPLLPSDDQNYAILWVEKMKPSNQIEIMKQQALLLQLLHDYMEKGMLQFPFTRDPPPKLQGLNFYVDLETYKKMMEKHKMSVQHILLLGSQQKHNGASDRCLPAKDFFPKQPKPKGGIFCYAIAFSDWKSDE